MRQRYNYRLKLKNWKAHRNIFLNNHFVGRAKSHTTSRERLGFKGGCKIRETNISKVNRCVCNKNAGGGVYAVQLY